MPGTVALSTLIEVLYAAHLSTYVESKFLDPGGIMFVGPPATLRSTLLAGLERHYHNALMLSDVNAQSLAVLRGSIAQGTTRTLVLPELQKLYERDPRTAANVEGNIRAMAAEGFASAGFEDARVNRLKARCVVIGAVTDTLQAKMFRPWEDTGFNRRFLWPLLTLDDPDVLERAIEEQTLIDFDPVPAPPIPQDAIPDTTTKQERVALKAMVRYQPGGAHATQLSLMVKMCAVLKWAHRRQGRPAGDAMRVLRDFAVTLGKHGARLVVPAPWYTKNGHGKGHPAKKKPTRKTHRCPRCGRLHPGNCRGTRRLARKGKKH